MSVLEPREEPPAKRMRLSSLDGADDMDVKEPIDPYATESLSNLVQDAVDEQLQKELNVGITESVSKGLAGFEGILKQRYTDFLVNEITPNGEVLHLVNLVPVPPKPLQLAPEQEPNDAGGSAVADGVSDQQSNEHATGNNTAHENDIKDPESARDNGQEPTVGVQLSEEDRNALLEILSGTTVDSVVALYEDILKRPQEPPRKFAQVFSEPLESREARTKLHQAVRKIFNSKIETQTSGTNVISFTAAHTTRPPQRVAHGRARHFNKHSDERARGPPVWQELGGEYIHFTLYKENKDTMEAMYFLASQIKCPVKRFQFAGTKDRRAVTVQRASAYRVHSKELFAIGQRLKASKIGDFEYCPYGLELGDAKGNEFTISLRDCHFAGEENLDFDARLEHAQKVVKESIEVFSAHGFINYYGLQRFGSFSTGTHVVGTKLLQADYKGAVEAILDFNPNLLKLSASKDKVGKREQADAANGQRENEAASSATSKLAEQKDKISSDDIHRAVAINIWHTKQNSRMALEKLPRKFSAEHSLIQQLGVKDRQGNLRQLNNYAGALGTIPRNLRLMYIHAYQSLVWNHAAGERWKLYGSHVVEGDLVIVDKKAAQEAEPDVDDDGEPIVRPPPEDADPFERARALTASEAQSGKYTVYDIVLPTPGYDVVYPKNSVGAFYESFMASQVGGGLDPHNMRRDWKDLSLSGGYRKLMARPTPGMTAEVKAYTSDSEQFVATDMDRIRARQRVGGHLEGVENMPGMAEKVFEQAQQPVVIEAEGKEGEDRKIAVVVKLQLGSSQYATMALRELMGKGGCKVYKPDFGGGR